MAFTVVISSGVTSSGLVLDSTKFEHVLSGGVASANVINSGGFVTVDSGGLTVGDTVSSGGTEALSAGALASGVTVAAGGLLSGDGTVLGATVDGFLADVTLALVGVQGSFVSVESGGVASGVKVDQLCQLTVQPGGSALDTTLEGGALSVSGSSATASGVVVGGGFLQVADGGVASAARVFGDGVAYVGGVSSVGASAHSGVLSGATVSSGGLIEVDAFGVAQGVTVANGGVLQLDSSGAANQVTVNGGSVVAGTGATLFGAVIGGGGQMRLRADAIVTDIRVNSGSFLIDRESVGLGVNTAAKGAVVLNGILEEGASFGALKATIAGTLTGSGILAQIGAGLTVLSGADAGFKGEVIIAGGAVEFATPDGATRVLFSEETVNSGGPATTTLQVDAAARTANRGTFGAALDDFNLSTERLDMAGLAYVKGAHAYARNGLLTVVDGGYTTHFKLTGSSAARYRVVNEGHGGILVRAAPVLTQAAPAATPQARPEDGAVVVVSSGATASGLVLNSALSEQVLSGGLAISNTVSAQGAVTVESGGRTLSDTVLSGGVVGVSSGGEADLITVSAGGELAGYGRVVGGTVAGYLLGVELTTRTGLYGGLALTSGGYAAQVSVGSGALFAVQGSALAISTTVIGGEMTLDEYAVGSATRVVRGGIEVVAGSERGGVAGSGGTIVVTGTLISGSPSGVSYADGDLSGGRVLSGGRLEVLQGGYVESATIYTGGSAAFEAGSFVETVTVAGGYAEVSYDGYVSDVTVQAGGGLRIRAGADCEFVNVQSGAAIVDGGVLAKSVQVGAQGVLSVDGTVYEGLGYAPLTSLAGRLAGSGSVIQAGSGTLRVSGNATGFTGTFGIEGGVVELAAATGAKTIDFDEERAGYFGAAYAYSTLKVDAGVQPASGKTFGAALDDFTLSSERLDLAGVAFTSGARARVVGSVLRVTDGAYTASFRLTGDHATRYVVASDGHGGTLIHAGLNAPIVQGQSLRQAAAAFAPAAAAAGGSIVEHEAPSAFALAAPTRRPPAPV